MGYKFNACINVWVLLYYLFVPSVSRPNSPFFQQEPQIHNIKIVSRTDAEWSEPIAAPQEAD